MLSEPPSSLRVEKARAAAVLTLTTGATVPGHFFVALAGPAAPGPERVADLLNAEPGFFPFETADGGIRRTVLYNRAHVVMAAVPPDEAQRDAGYGVATPRAVSLLLTTGGRVDGRVRVYRPAGRDRLSDWARNSSRFRYLERRSDTLIVNVDHVVDAREVPEP